MLVHISRANKVGREIVWNYFKENHAMFIEKYESGGMLSRLISGMLDDFASLDKLQEVSDYFAANAVPATERTVKQSLEKIKSNSEWLSRDSTNIKNYLTNSN